VPAIRCTHVEVYVFRRTATGPRFLILRRARSKSLPGVWQPVTGKLDRGESAQAAAAREVLEETGLAPRAWWVLETVTTFFDPAVNTLLLVPLFAAEAPPKGSVRLSAEHDAFAYVSARTAARRFLWDSQRTGLQAVMRQVLRGGALARALALPPGRAAAARRRRGGARTAAADASIGAPRARDQAAGTSSRVRR
jgi:dihydroneopterin triphosphate diphosphatase